MELVRAVAGKKAVADPESLPKGAKKKPTKYKQQVH